MSAPRRVPMTLHLHFKGMAHIRVRVYELADAAKAFEAHRDFMGYGASDMVGQCGEVTRRGRLVARVSYNGRVWVDGKPVDGMSGAEWLRQASGVGVTL